MKTMNMISKIVLLAVLASTSFAYAQSLPPTKTFEALATSIRLPVSANGTIALRESEHTDYISVRVTPKTRYQIDNKTMRLDEFRKAVRNLLQGGEFTINVVRDETSQTVDTVYVYAD